MPTSSLNENESLLQKSPASRNNPPPPPWECTIICRDNAGSPIFQHLVNFQFYTPISKGECGGTFSGAVINASKCYSEQEFLPNQYNSWPILWSNMELVLMLMELNDLNRAEMLPNDPM